MSDWVRRASQYLLIGMLFISLGGHLAVFQTIAWANMLKDFSQTASIEEAARKTFSGEHPCSLCKVVRESRKQEEKKPLLKVESKLDVALPTPVRLKEPRGVPVVIVVPAYYGHGSVVSLGVPLQPPRSV
jgi:hypothetical protein